MSIDNPSYTPCQSKHEGNYLNTVASVKPAYSSIIPLNYGMLFITLITNLRLRTSVLNMFHMIHSILSYNYFEND